MPIGISREGKTLKAVPRTNLRAALAFAPADEEKLVARVLKHAV
jgi:hypothetical protein